MGLCIEGGVKPQRAHADVVGAALALRLWAVDWRIIGMVVQKLGGQQSVCIQKHAPRIRRCLPGGIELVVV